MGCVRVIVAIFNEVHANLLVCDVVIVYGLPQIQQTPKEEDNESGVLDSDS